MTWDLVIRLTIEWVSVEEQRRCWNLQQDKVSRDGWIRGYTLWPLDGYWGPLQYRWFPSIISGLIGRIGRTQNSLFLTSPGQWQPLVTMPPPVPDCIILRWVLCLYGLKQNSPARALVGGSLFGLSWIFIPFPLSSLIIALWDRSIIIKCSFM